jgi:hypothetical protein
MLPSATVLVLGWMKLHYVLLWSSIWNVKPHKTFLLFSSWTNMINMNALPLNVFTAIELIKIFINHAVQSNKARLMVCRPHSH